MLDRELEYTLNTGFKEARDKRHEYFTVEHFTLALLDNASAAKALRVCGVSIDELKELLKAFIDKTTPKIPASVKDRETQPTLGLQRILQRAVFRAQSSGMLEATGANALEAVFDESASRSVHFLEKAGVDRQTLANYVYSGSVGVERESAPKRFSSLRQQNPELGELLSQNTPEEEGLKVLCNLNEKAKENKVDPLIGCEDVLEHIYQVLGRRRKNNPLLIGEPGVGKTAIVEGLAKMVVEGKAPKHLLNSTVYNLDLGGLLAGTKYRGDFEKRMQEVLEKLNQAEQAILFIDEIHTIIGAGSASGGVIDVANLLKPLLSSGEFRCIGSTTFQEYRRVFEKDSALARRFQTIEVREPSVDETRAILEGLRDRLETHHQVKYTDEAIRAAAELSARHIHDRFLPDKAIDVMDEAGAYHRLLPTKHRTGIIDEKIIESIVAKIARIPERNVSRSDKIVLKTLERDLKSVIYGQDQAISALTSAIKLARSGLREGHKPIGSFLFAGPTGVGKTEVARQLARLLGVELLRFDMSEYQEHHTVSRLVGSPPGYVGFEEGGMLTESVYKHPHSVLLLDEIEKAHSEIYNLLLQVMDYGVLTDSNGRKINFDHTIIIMTTNAGADILSRAPMGFTSERVSEDSMEAIRRVFTPEFRNRLDAIVPFQALDSVTIANVVNKFVAELVNQLAQKHVTLKVDEEARLWFAKHGYDPEQGARPMARLLDEKLKKPLADELLFGELMHGGEVHVSVLKEELSLLMKALVSAKQAS